MAGAAGRAAAGTMEQRVLAFAEQLGRMAGRLEAEAATGREALNEQIARIRDGAADLLEQLAGGATEAPTAAPKKRKPAAAAPRDAGKGRSGGAVDAPGKRRRPRAAADPGRHMANSQAAKMRTAMTMTKTNRRRGRG